MFISDSKRSLSIHADAKRYSALFLFTAVFFSPPRYRHGRDEAARPDRHLFCTEHGLAKSSQVCKPFPMSPSPKCPRGPGMEGPSFSRGSHTPSYVARLRAVPPVAKRGFAPSASLPDSPSFLPQNSPPRPPRAAIKCKARGRLLLYT